MCSPVFIAQLSSFSLTNVSQNLMLNVANDLMLSSGNVGYNETTFEAIQQKFDLSRGMLGIALPPLCGIINEISSVFFKKSKFNGVHTDLQYIFVVFVLQALVLCLTTGSILVDNIWFFLILQPILFSIMNNAFITGINVCYPVSVRATYLSFGNLASTALMFIQEPIMKQIKVWQVSLSTN